MIDPAIKEKILHQIEVLPHDLQKKMLDFSRSLARDYQKGADGKELLKFSGAFNKSDLKAMESAITESCERVDVNEW
jgi:hypothetical protein